MHFNKNNSHILLYLTLLFIILTTSITIFELSKTQNTKQKAAYTTLRERFVSPNGNDTSPGTATLPWRTFYKAAQLAIAGDKVIFEDGTYTETATTEVLNSGTATNPIIFEARNQHKAKIFYQNLSEKWKISVVGKQHIHIKNFEITQDLKGSTGLDKFINYFGGANFGVVSGNKIHNAFEDLVKIGQTDNIIVENNTLFDVTREAFDQVGGAGTIIRNNTISDFHREGIMVKGGARNVEISNNTVRRNATTWAVGMTLGGSSDAEFAYDPSGYEGYNLIAYNNVFIAEVPGAISEALSITGCDTCSYVNNIVIGADIAMTIADGPGTSKGWTVDVHTRNPRFQNNIIMDCKKNTIWQYSTPTGTFIYDNNLIYNCPNATIPTQAHGIYTDPKFVNKLTDWTLTSTSPAIGKGIKLSPFPAFTDANTIPLQQISESRDKNGVPRIDPWDIGVYESKTPPLTSAISDFNSDSLIDLLDFNLWRSEFLTLITSKLSDANKDGVIDLLDFNTWLNEFRTQN